jgi:hypothetical protein
MEPEIEEAVYLDFVKAFASAGCIKLAETSDNKDVLLTKFRAQLKKLKISVEKAYKTFDPNNYGRVQKKDFIQDCQTMGL